MEILKTLDTLIFFAGVYLLFVGSFITKLEIECGIANIPCNAAVRLALLFIVGLLCLVSSFVLWFKIEKL